MDVASVADRDGRLLHHDQGTVLRRRLIGGVFAAALLTGCTTLESGNGRPAQAIPSQTGASGTEPTEPTETTETSESTEPTGSEDPALAFAIGFQFAAHINTDNPQLAFS